MTDERRRDIETRVRRHVAEMLVEIGARDGLAPASAPHDEVCVAQSCIFQIAREALRGVERGTDRELVS